MSRPLLFDDFVAGQTLGRVPFDITPSLLARWSSIYAEAATAEAAVPMGLVSVVVMRAYLQAVAPRPPGNVHGAQSFRVSALPRLGQRLYTTVTCLGKELRRERRWVRLATDTRDEAGQPLFDGRMTILWAG